MGQANIRRSLDLVRTCGNCTACCTLMEVRGDSKLPMFEGGVKPAGTSCPRLYTAETKGRGCAIYGERPTPCRAWSCVWRNGGDALSNAESPENTGIMFAATQVAGVTVLYAYEVWEGAFGPAADLLERLAEKFVVALVGTSETYGDEVKVEKVRQALLMKNAG